MINGGYQIIDFSGIVSFDGSESIPGVCETIKTCKKPILVSGIRGSYAFSYDVTPNQTYATCVIPEVSGSTVTWKVVRIAADDTVSIIS